MKNLWQLIFYEMFELRTFDCLVLFMYFGWNQKTSLFTSQHTYSFFDIWHLLVVNGYEALLDNYSNLKTKNLLTMFSNLMSQSKTRCPKKPLIRLLFIKAPLFCKQFYWRRPEQKYSSCFKPTEISLWGSCDSKSKFVHISKLKPDLNRS